VESSGFPLLDDPIKHELTYLRTQIETNELKYNDLLKMSKALGQYTFHKRNVYMESLLDPAAKLDAKIPALAPIPTSSI